MTMIFRMIPSVFVALVLLAVPAWGQATELRLRDGSTLQGSIIAVDIATGVRLDIGEGIEVQLSWDYLDPVEAKPHRRRLVKSDLDADALFAFGQWCQQYDLAADAEATFLKVVELNSNHLPARRALGHVKFERKWMTRPEHEAIVRRRAEIAEQQSRTPPPRVPGTPDRPTPEPEPEPDVDDGRPEPATSEPRDPAEPITIVLNVNQVIGEGRPAGLTAFSEALAEFLEDYDFVIVESDGDFTITGTAELRVTSHPRFFGQTLSCTIEARATLTISPASDQLNSKSRSGAGSGLRNTVAKARFAAVAALVWNLGPKLVGVCQR